MHSLILLLKKSDKLNNPFFFFLSFPYVSTQGAATTKKHAGNICFNVVNPIPALFVLNLRIRQVRLFSFVFIIIISVKDYFERHKTT